MYNDATEIIEALGFNPAFGVREWLGDLHVDDVTACAEALDAMQRGVKMRWLAMSEEADFLFTELIDDCAHELGIEHEELAPCDDFVRPSFLSFGVSPIYIIKKIEQFFRTHCLGHTPKRYTMTYQRTANKDEWHITLQNIENGWRDATLVRLPVHFKYADHGEIRCELSRMLQEAIRRYGLCRYYDAHGLSVRRLHWEGVQFVESLWGMEVPRS